MGRKRKNKNKSKKNKAKKNKGKVVFSQTTRNITYKPKSFKGNEIKIKKIIKQPTEKKNLQHKRLRCLSKTWGWKNSFYRKSKNRKY